MSDKPVTKCPICGARASRIISGGQGVIFKGSGFYITDYGKDGKGARKDPDTASGAPSSESKTEAQPSPAAETAKPEAKPAGKGAKSAKPGKSEPT